MRYQKGFIILLVLGIFAIQEVLSISDCYDKPSDNCDCQKFVNSIGDCVERCEQDEMEVEFELEKKFKFKKCECKKQNSYRDSKNKCVDQCPDNEIISPDYNRCYEKSIDCPKDTIYSEKRNTCTKKCDGEVKGDFTAEFEEEDKTKQKKCVACPDTKKFLVNGKCTKCSAGQLNDEKSNTCISKEDCKGEISEDKQNCVACSVDKLYDKRSKTCISKEECQGEISEDKQNCVACSVGKLYDEKSKTCISKEECKGEISEDKQNCVACPDTKKFIVNGKCTFCSEGKLQAEKSNTCISEEECKGYVSEDNVCLKECPQDQFKMQGKNEQIKCKKACDQKKYKLKKDEKSEIFECLESCPTDYVIDLQIKHCIKQEECKDYVFQGQCYQACPEDQVYTENKKKVKVCRDKCAQTYYQQTDSKECKQTCKENELYDDKINKCLVHKDCKKFISRDLLSCSDKCQKQEYPVKEGDLQYCHFCFNNLYIDHKKIECLKVCPDSKKLTKKSNLVQECASEQDLETFLLSSDKKFYYKNCQYPDFVEKKDDKDHCVPKCSDENKYIMYDGIDRIECTKSCDQNMKKSSDGKYCIKKCSHLFEIDPESGDTCTKCENNKYIRFNNSTHTFKCSDINDDKDSIQLRIDSLSNSFGPIKNIILEKIYDYYQDQINYILNHIQKNNIIIEKQKQLKQIVHKYNYRIKGEKRYSPNIFGSDKIRVISQQISLKYEREFNNALSLSNLKSDKVDLTKESSNKFGQPSKFNQKSLIIVVSHKNLFCNKDSTEQKCLTEQIIVLDDQREFTVSFDINDKNNDINLYKCLTTNINGEMKKSIKTEITANLKDAKEVKCTFISNVSLFYDSKNEFIDKKICTEDKPYTFENDCVAVCPDKLDTARKVCVSKCEESQILVGNECLNDKKACKKYLVDNKICSENCTGFEHIQQDLPYKICNSKCDFNTYKVKEKTFCLESCKINQITDKESKKCYDDKKECKGYISFNGKECNSQCSESESSNDESSDGYKQCKCNKMVYISDDKNESKQCVSEDFCKQKKISSLDSSICRDSCIQPEINFGQKCLQKCDEGTYFQPKDNSCQEKCNAFISQDEKLCLFNCETIFEVVDDKVEEKKKKCKKCNDKEYLSLVGTEKKCKLIAQTDDTQKSMEKSLNKRFEDVIQSVDEVTAALQEIRKYAKVIELNIKDISKKEVLTEDDTKQSKSLFQNISKITQDLLNKVDYHVFNTPQKIETSEFMIISQVAKPGQRFKTDFNTNDIQPGQDLSLDSNLETTNFYPDSLQLSYFKKNLLCFGKQCGNSSILYSIKYMNKEQKRQLTDIPKQKFNMTYDKFGKILEKHVCLSYDSNGKVSGSKGEIKENQITCKFEEYTALFYDESCQYVDQQLCKGNDKVSQITEKDKKTGSSFITVIYIVIIFAVFAVIYFILKSKPETKPNNKKIHISYEDDDYLTVNSSKRMDSKYDKYL